MYGADISNTHPDSRWQNEPGSTKANRFRVGAVADVVGRTALVTGGTRGIGLEFCRWAARHGARHLLLLAQSRATGPAVEDYLK